MLLACGFRISVRRFDNIVFQPAHFHLVFREDRSDMNIPDAVRRHSAGYFVAERVIGQVLLSDEFFIGIDFAQFKTRFIAEPD